MSTYVSYRDGGKTTEEGLFKWLSRLFGQGNPVTYLSTSMKVVQRGAGANMSVDISTGDAHIVYSTYSYYGWIDAVDNETVSAADGTNPRKDIVVAYVDLSVVSSATDNNLGALKFAVVAGTAAASPSDPSGATIQAAVGSGNPYIQLARLTIPAGVTSVVTAYITDIRTNIKLNADVNATDVTTSTLEATSTVSLSANLDINDSSTAIRDSSDNELLKFSKTASAVNEFTVANAATAGLPTLSVTGGDTDISLRTKAKGAGTVQHGRPVAFRATTTDTVSGGAAPETINSYTEVYDYGSNFDHTTGIFTAPYDGIYHFSGCVAVSNQTSDTARMEITIVTSGGNTKQYAFNTVDTHDPAVSAAIDVALSASQTASMSATLEGSDLGLDSPSYFAGHLLGRTD